jgi:S-disulfanyl-L-cysteine oxidoreductase SoxD
MKRRDWILLASLFLASLIFVSCSSQISTLPPVQSSPNAVVPTASTQMALPSDTPPAAAPTEGTEAAVPETQEPAGDIARPSNPGGPGKAVSLTGSASAGQATFTQICAACHGPNGTQGIANPGSNDGSVPPLNPIDDTIVSPDHKVFATNIDLFIEHGSTPEGSGPQVKMPAFGDTQILTPQQIADVIAYVISLNASPAASGSPAPAGTPPTPIGNLPAGSPVPGNTEAVETPLSETAEPAGDIARPSNPGAAGQAVNLVGNAAVGQATFTQICSACHGPNGTQGIANPGSNDGSVPPLNPIDDTIVNTDPKIFATNIDLFIEHGSTPEGSGPQVKMPAFGETGVLTPQQIADVIAYVISLNTKK